jgi:NADP-dependent 3-hydroxy acid dehydrogenase YdfG
VLAAVRDPKKAKELQDLAKKYSNAEVHQLDVPDEKSIRSLAEELDGQPIDVLIDNFGVYPRVGQKLGEIDYAGCGGRRA